MSANILYCCLFGSFLQFSLATNCEQDWIPYKDNCYWFNLELTGYPKAKNKCIQMGSSLLHSQSINDISFLKIHAQAEGNSRTSVWVHSEYDDKEEDNCTRFLGKRMTTFSGCSYVAETICRKPIDKQKPSFHSPDPVTPLATYALGNIRSTMNIPQIVTTPTPHRTSGPKNHSTDMSTNFLHRRSLRMSRGIIPPITEYIKPLTTLGPSVKCKMGDFAILGSCYHMGNNEVLTWAEASEYCKNYSNAYLFSINNMRELDAIMMRTKSEIWLGLTFQNDSSTSTASCFRWQSGKQNTFFYWWEVDLVNIRSDQCFSTFPRRNGQRGILNTGNCERKNLFICEYDETYSTVEQSIYYNSRSDMCLRKGWHYEPNTERCAKYIKTYAKWKEAEWTCNSAGGHLASYREDTYLSFQKLVQNLNVKETAVWTGTYIDADNELSQTNGEAVSYFLYRNFDRTLITTKGISSNKRYCVAYHTEKRKIINYPCDAYLHFVCLAKTDESGMSITMPISPSFDRCNSSDWFRFNNSCYKIHGDKADTATRARAVNQCENEGATLASITSYDENYWIASLTYQYPTSDFWIGGTRGRNGFYWTDNLPFLYTNWDTGEPNNHGEIENCISFYGKAAAMWNDERCSVKNGFICKKSDNVNGTFDNIGASNSSASNISTGDVANADSDSIYYLDVKENPNYSECAGEWFRMGSRCIYIGNTSLSFDDSIKFCRSLHKYGNLVSIHSMKDQATLNFGMFSKANKVWIGLKTSIRGTYWTDESEYDFQYWAPRLSLSGRRAYDCMESRGLPSFGGKWNRLECDTERQPACSKPYYETELTMQYCSPPYDDFLKENKGCYLLVRDKKTWKDAEEYCLSLYSNLVWIEDYVDQSYVWYKSFNLTDHDVWIGLKSQSDMTYIDKEHSYKKWSNSRHVLYTNWAEKEPLFNTQDQCSALDIRNGKWFVHLCSMKKSFICKHHTELPSKTVQVTGSCPSPKWRDLGGRFCYYFQNDYRLPWNEASDWCNREGGYLASIHSSEENDLLSAFVRSTDLSAWIGLHRSFVGAYVWSDRTVRDYQAWASNEPTTNTNEYCAELNEERQWNDLDCSNVRPFICKAHKSRNSTEKSLKSSSSSSSHVMYIAIPILLFVIGTLGWLVRRYFSSKNTKTVQITSRMSLGELESTIIYSNSSDDADEE